MKTLWLICAAATFVCFPLSLSPSAFSWLPQVTTTKAAVWVTHRRARVTARRYGWHYGPQVQVWHRPPYPYYRPWHYGYHRPVVVRRYGYVAPGVATVPVGSPFYYSSYYNDGDTYYGRSYGWGRPRWGASWNNWNGGWNRWGRW